jgi:glutathione S-transferase
MKLYACPGTCSLAPHILLHHFEVPHEIAWIDLRKGEGRTPEFLEINPLGQVPTLVSEEGEVITEVSAILLYLFQRFGELDTPLHQTVRQLSFVASELHKSFGPIFFATRIMGEGEGATTLANYFRGKLEGHWKFIDDLLPEPDGLGDREMGPADPYLYTTCRWWKAVGGDFAATPNLESFLAHMEARPAVQAALAVEKLEPVAAAEAEQG